MAEFQSSASERSGAIRLLDGVDKFIGLICRSVVLATLSGAAACGLATYAGLGTPGI